MKLTEYSAEYRDVELDGYGEPVRVYQVPQPLIWGFRPKRPMPRLPEISMPIATGRVQKRGAREGDPEFAAYQADLEAWHREEDELQSAAALVLALRDVEYPEDMSQPPPWLPGELSEQYPAGDIERKAFWLKATVLSKATNYNRVMAAHAEMSFGAQEVDDLKARFRPDLPGDSGSPVDGDGHEPEGEDRRQPADAVAGG